MKVSELIELLKEFPGDLDVVGTDSAGLPWEISVWRNSSADEEGETSGEWDQVEVSVG